MKEISNQKILNTMQKGFGRIDKRFEQVDKRFEQVDKRFEQVDKRFIGVESDIYTLRVKVNEIDERTKLIPKLYNNTDAFMKEIINSREAKV